MGKQVDAGEIFFLKKVLQNVRSKLKNIRTYFLFLKKYYSPPAINYKLSNLLSKYRVLGVQGRYCGKSKMRENAGFITKQLKVSDD